MPYKDEEKRPEYMKKYREFKRWQMTELRKALEEENGELAKKILNMKLSEKADF